MSLATTDAIHPLAGLVLGIALGYALAMAPSASSPSPPPSPSPAEETHIRVEKHLPGGKNRYYVANRPPLSPSPLVKLPIGSIEPEGWVRGQLVRLRDGMVGHLDELSPFVRPDSAWLELETRNKKLETRRENSSSREMHCSQSSGTQVHRSQSSGTQVHCSQSSGTQSSGTQPPGWEEAPYWLKGFGDLGYVLRDDEVMAQARRWIDAAVESQQPDGWFGPADNKARRDLWPNMIMLYALRSRSEATGDERIVPMMTRYVRYLRDLPEGDLLPFRWGDGAYRKEWWQSARAGDLLESIYWLYNRTGDAWLLELATRVYRRSADWEGKVASWHGVNICQGFRTPATYYQQSHDARLLEASEAAYRQVYDTFGQVPGGMFGADENCRPGFTGPRQAAETCSMVEMMHSQQSLLKITGDAVHADRCEGVALNSLPAALTADLGGLHYLTAPNMVLLDGRSKAPGLQNGGNMLTFDPWRYRCCQHNVSYGWPYFAEHLWLATAAHDGGGSPRGGEGLAAVFYAPCQVRAKVGEAGEAVTLREITDYPFDETIEFVLAAKAAVRFPLSLRIPGWCDGAVVRVNDIVVAADLPPEAFVTIDRTWQNGDRVRLVLPMEVRVRTWEAHGGCVSIYRGPLAYSLKIDEEWRVRGGTDRWPAYEVHPASPWNYGLDFDQNDVGMAFVPMRNMTASADPAPEPIPDQPFDARRAPIRLLARGRRVPGWELDDTGLVGEVQQSPAKVESGPSEEIELIPMGCARLRVTVFPRVSSGPEGHPWVAPPPPPQERALPDADAANLIPPPS